MYSLSCEAGSASLGGIPWKQTLMYMICKDNFLIYPHLCEFELIQGIVAGRFNFVQSKCYADDSTKPHYDDTSPNSPGLPFACAKRPYPKFSITKMLFTCIIGCYLITFFKRPLFLCLILFVRKHELVNFRDEFYTGFSSQPRELCLYSPRSNYSPL